MSLTKWRPLKSSFPKIWNDDLFDIDRPFFGLNRLFREGLHIVSEDFGATDIYEENGNIVAEINLPGMKADDIDLEVEKDTIRISADAQEEKEDKDEGEGRKYYAREMVRRSVSRILPLPQSVRGKEAKAEYNDGILRVTVPKQESKTESTKIKVKK